jgi:hypothetical protein
VISGRLIGKVQLLDITTDKPFQTFTLKEWRKYMGPQNHDLMQAG